MRNRDYNSLSEAMDDLKSEGYKEDFKAEEDFIAGLYSGKTYKPSDLVVSDTFRFEGESNPSDSTELMVIEAKDGTKGTLVMSFGAKQSQNVDLIRQIPVDRDLP